MAGKHDGFGPMGRDGRAGVGFLALLALINIGPVVGVQAGRAGSGAALDLAAGTGDTGAIMFSGLNRREQFSATHRVETW